MRGDGKMKKIIAVLGTAAAIFAAQTVGAVDVFVNSVPVGFNDSVGYPFIENGRTLVPLRASMEALGAEVSWDGASNTAVVRKGTTTVACVIGENCVYRNGTKIVNDAAAVIRGSRTYLPIRVVAEALDAEVLWDGNVRITSGAAGNLIYSIENSGSHVSPAELWKLWDSALLQKASADYNAAIETIKRIAPDFIAANDGNSSAMLYKHLGECYSELNLSAEASACFAREAQFWTQMGKTQETIDANRRSGLISSGVQMYAKTDRAEYAPQTKQGKFASARGIYLGAYAEGDPAVHNAATGTPFYMNAFPDLAGRDMASYLLYLPDSKPLSTYQSHIEAAKQRNKILQIAVEPSSLSAITENDSRYVKLAQDMEQSGAKFLVRLACEMNEESCPWYTTDYNLYIRKFRIMASIFHTYAPNSAAVVWSPNFYPSDNISLYYPGDEYVDYVGISSYKNHQPETDPLGQNVDRSRWSDQLDTICGLYGYKKPIIVSEGAASYMDYNTWGDITPFASSQLYDFLAYLPIKYPQVKAFYIYDHDRERYRFSLSSNSEYLSAYRRGIASQSYLSEPNTDAGFEYYELGTNAAIPASVNEISAYIKTVKNDIAYVVYRINGADCATAYAAPFSAAVDFSPYAGQSVNLTALAFDSSGAIAAQKTYRINVR